MKKLAIFILLALSVPAFAVFGSHTRTINKTSLINNLADTTPVLRKTSKKKHLSTTEMHKRMVKKPILMKEAKPAIDSMHKN